MPTMQHYELCLYMYIHVHVNERCTGKRKEERSKQARHVPSPTRGSSFFLGKVTALGVLCCFALFVCLTLLASFFLPSHLSLKTCTCKCSWHKMYSTHTFSEAVARRVPCRLRAMQLMAASWAGMSTGGF